MDDFLSPAWRAELAHHGLADFDALWQLPLPWFEPPNQRRGGWSGVSRHDFISPTGQRHSVFIKRQENHQTFSWRHPLRGIPTFLREFRLLLRYRASGVPTLDPVYFARRATVAGQRAILITVALDGYVPLDAYVAGWPSPGYAPLAERRRVLCAVADLTRRIHDGRIQHNCYYPKHIFVRVLPQNLKDQKGSKGAEGTAAAHEVVDARVIDLEKSRGRPLAVFCALRDLDTLNRHAPEWSRSERLRFLKAYLRCTRLSPYGKWLWRRLAARAARRHGA